MTTEEKTPGNSALGSAAPPSTGLSPRQIPGPGQEVYQGLAGDIAKTIAPATEADPAALLIQLLVTFGNIIGRSARFLAEWDWHFANMFVVLVGRSSKARKGSSWSYVRELMRQTDSAWCEHNIGSGLSSGEGLTHAVRDPVVKKELAKNDEGTAEYQSVIVDQGVQDKRLLVLESEFAVPLRVMERAGCTLSPIIRQAWDDGRLQTLTKNSPTKATNAHISIIGHTTAEEVRKYLTRTEMGNGFGNRFLWCWVERAQVLPEGGTVDQAAYGQLIIRLKDAFAFATRVNQMTRDGAARALWHQAYPAISRGASGLLGALTSRAEAQVMRLACIYALLDKSAVIQRQHLEAALALWKYCERSVRHIFDQKTGDPLEDAIATALQAHPQGLTRTQLHNYLGNHQNARPMTEILQRLLAAEKVRRESKKTGGRPVERWFWIGA